VAEEFMKLKEELTKNAATDFYTRWARWFCGDGHNRTISPFSSVTVPDYVQRRIEENTIESLQEAIRLSVTNGLAFSRLAQQTLAQDTRENPRRIGEADFFSRRALELSPSDPEVQRLRAEIAEQIKDSPKP
jgi:hypothetical protein